MRSASFRLRALILRTVSRPFTYNRIGCGIWEPGDAATLERLGVTNVLLHAGVYEQAGDRSAWFAWRGLEEAGWAPGARGGAITLFTRGSSSAPPPFAEPARTQPVLCRGWRDGVMIELQAPLWLYGDELSRLAYSSAEPIRVTISVDGEEVADTLVDGEGVSTLQLEAGRWHAVVFEASRPGLRLDDVR